MNLLVIADIYGELKSLDKVISSAERHSPEILICPGNFTNMFSPHTDFSQLDVAEIVIQKLLSLNIPTFCVPGNHDPPTILELFEEYSVNIHMKTRSFRGKVFVGFGGAKTPFKTSFEPSEAETSSALMGAGEADVLVTHNPPKNTKVDKIKSGEHVGSVAVRNHIEKTQPTLAISAHIPESHGSDVLGKTVVFNPGSCGDLRYGLVELGKKVVAKNIKA